MKAMVSGSLLLQLLLSPPPSPFAETKNIVSTTLLPMHMSITPISLTACPRMGAENPPVVGTVAAGMPLGKPSIPMGPLNEPATPDNPATLERPDSRQERFHHQVESQSSRLFRSWPRFPASSQLLRPHVLSAYSYAFRFFRLNPR